MIDPLAVDPVCGAPLERLDKQLERAVRGAVYHFCSRACLSRFVSDEDRFVAQGARRSTLRGRVTLPVLGLGCGGGGAASIERELSRTTGVLWAYVNPATEMAYVEYHPHLLTPSAIAAVIEGLGYRSPLDPGSASSEAASETGRRPPDDPSSGGHSPDR